MKYDLVEQVPNINELHKLKTEKLNTFDLSSF